MSKLGRRLIASAKEARKIARGEADPSTYRLHLPADIDVQSIRKSLGLSQTVFASRFGIAPGTLRDWELRMMNADVHQVGHQLVRDSAGRRAEYRLT